MTVSIENRNESRPEAQAALPMQQLATRADASSQNGSASISSNDFLTLLVTEMQNQDPTANTDPNEYINQLVNVNSLEQLISINQELSGVSASSGSQAGPATPDSVMHGTSSSAHPVLSPSATAATASSTHRTLVEGNLGVPPPNAAADRVAHALGGKSVKL